MNEMIRIGMIEDDSACVAQMKALLSRYGEEKNILIESDVFTYGEEFLESRRKDRYDLLLIDIDLPGLNGWECAKRLREQDSVLPLMFVTSLAQFAVNGYEVSALDFLVKPVSYTNFRIKMNRALAAISNSQDHRVIVNTRTERICMGTRDILYVEVRGHWLTFHKTDGSSVDVSGSLNTISEELHNYGFALCNACYLVNMRYVTRMDALNVTLTNGIQLQISMRKRKSFADEFTAYVGKGDALCL